MRRVVHPSTYPSDPTLAAASTAGWVERLARFGYAARGFVYVLIGVLAVRLALGDGGQATGPRGALRSLTEEPFGMITLSLLALGLAAYALWRVVQGIRDTEGKGRKPKGLVVRAGMLGSGAIHAAWAALAAGLVIGASAASGGGGGEDQQAQGWTATAMAQPLGRWLVAAVGGGIAAFGLHQIVMGVRDHFMKRIATERMRERARGTVKTLGRVGLTARGLVFILSGAFLLAAAWRFDASQAKGLGGTMASLLDQPFGPWLLGAAALGVLAFGAYNMLLARYRRISVPHHPFTPA